MDVSDKTLSHHGIFTHIQASSMARGIVEIEEVEGSGLAVIEVIHFRRAISKCKLETVGVIVAVFLCPATVVGGWIVIMIAVTITTTGVPTSTSATAVVVIVPWAANL